MSENERSSSPVNLKHRLIGAVILVSLAVIFLPMIFSEREPPAELKAISEIPGKGSAPETPPTAPANEYTVPEPVAESAGPAAKPAPEKKAAAPKAPAATAPARGWVVQVGIFANAANAAKLADKLRGQGFHVLSENVTHAGEKRVRLRVGPYADKAAAQQAQAKIQQQNHIAGTVLAYP